MTGLSSSTIVLARALGLDCVSESYLKWRVWRRGQKEWNFGPGKRCSPWRSWNIGRASTMELASSLIWGSTCYNAHQLSPSWKGVAWAQVGWSLHLPVEVRATAGLTSSWQQARHHCSKKKKMMIWATTRWNNEGCTKPEAQGSL